MADRFMNCFARPRQDFTPEEIDIVDNRVKFKRRDAAGTVECRLDEPRGAYRGLRVFVFDEVRAPYQTELKVFNALQDMGWFVAICYHHRRALDVVQNYLHLGPEQRFDGGVTVFKGAAG